MPTALYNYRDGKITSLVGIFQHRDDAVALIQAWGCNNIPAECAGDEVHQSDDSGDKYKLINDLDAEQCVVLAEFHFDGELYSAQISEVQLRIYLSVYGGSYWADEAVRDLEVITDPANVNREFWKYKDEPKWGVARSRYAKGGDTPEQDATAYATATATECSSSEYEAAHESISDPRD